MKKFYLSLLLLCCLSRLTAQSPGGVSANLSMWLKADAASTLSTTGSTVNSWSYFNNGSNVFTSLSGSEPTVASSTLNFLPSVAFNGTQYMSGPTGPGTPGAPIPAGSVAYSIFAVWSSTTPEFNPAERVWAQRSTTTGFDNQADGVSLWIYAPGQQYGAQMEMPPSFTTGLGLGYTPNTGYISQMNFLSTQTNDLELLDQTNIATGPLVLSTDPDPTNPTTVHRTNLSDAANILGAKDAALEEPFFGNLSELIVYTTPVSGTQRNQIFSYLSLKYGIPTNTSLVSSTGATVWDATANAAFNNFVFGLGMDNTSGLSNTQSNSSATGTGTGTGISGMGNIVLSSPSSLADQGFLIVGSNNAGFAESNSNLPSLAGPGSEVLATRWLTQITGTVGTVNLSFDFTGIFTTGTIGTPSDFRLVVDNDGDGDLTTGTQAYYTPTSFTGEVANFTGVDLTQSAKLAFAIMSSAGPGTPLPVTWSSFTATPAGNDVDLNWEVSANEKGKVYEVQHSTDGVSFATIGEVANVASIQSYSFVHLNAGAGKHYYRIQEVDLDGKSIYSKIVSVILNTADFAVRALNNPVVGNTPAEIEIDAVKAGNATIEVWTVGGIKVATSVQFVNPGASRVSLPLSGLASMNYIVKVSMNEGSQVVQIVKL